MKIIFDQATPVPIRPYLKGHLVRTAAQQGWDKLRNGDLLLLAESAQFDPLVTTDKSMGYTQNLTGRKIAIWFSANSSGAACALIQLVIDAVNAAVPGSYAELDFPLR